DRDRKTAAPQEEEPWTAGTAAVGACDFSPAKSSPKRKAAKDGECDVEKEKDQGVPEDHAADGELRFRQDEALEVFFVGETASGGVIEQEARLHNKQAGEAEKKKKDEMHPGPGDAQVLGYGRLVGRDWSGKSGGEADGIAGEREFRRSWLSRSGDGLGGR